MAKTPVEYHRQRRAAGKCGGCGAASPVHSKCDACLAKQRAKYYARKKKSVCVNCAEEPATDGVLCSTCKTRRAAAAHAREKAAYDACVAAGVCVQCGERDAAAGRNMCPGCHERATREPFDMHAYQTRRYATNKATGNCVWCKKAKARPDRVLCATCAAGQSAFYKEKRRGTGNGEVAEAVGPGGSDPKGAGGI